MSLALAFTIIFAMAIVVLTISFGLAARHVWLSAILGVVGRSAIALSVSRLGSLRSWLEFRWSLRIVARFVVGVATGSLLATLVVGPFALGRAWASTVTRGEELQVEVLPDVVLLYVREVSVSPATEGTNDPLPECVLELGGAEGTTNYFRPATDK